MIVVELLPDREADRSVREDWAALEAAGLPNLSRHRSSTNRPHVTVSSHRALPEDDPSARDEWLHRLRPLVARLPIVVPLGPTAVFGDPRSDRGVILVRTLVVTAELIRWRADLGEVWAEPDGDGGGPDDGWVPHLTLAQRLPVDELSRAITALPVRGGRGDDRRTVALAAVRLWDADAREVVPLPTD